MSLIVVLQNTSELADISTYRYQVRINDYVLEEGHVVNHPRSEGWAALLARLLLQRKPETAVAYPMVSTDFLFDKGTVSAIKNFAHPAFGPGHMANRWAVPLPL